jgi:hypothetical protein
MTVCAIAVRLGRKTPGPCAPPSACPGVIFLPRDCRYLLHDRDTKLSGRSAPSLRQVGWSRLRCRCAEARRGVPRRDARRATRRPPSAGTNPTGQKQRESAAPLFTVEGRVRRPGRVRFHGSKHGGGSSRTYVKSVSRTGIDEQCPPLRFLSICVIDRLLQFIKVLT